MEVLSIEADQSVTSIKPTERGRYGTSKSGAWKILHVNLNASTKICGNKGRIYTSTDAPGAYRNTKAENNTKTTTVMVHAGQINETTTLPLPTEE